MRYLPIGISTKDKKFLVLGGGYMAYLSIKRIIDTLGTIYVISDEFTNDIYNLEKENPDKIKLKKEELNEDFIFMGYDFVIIATNNFELNNIFEDRANSRNMLYERCDILSDSSISIYRNINHGPISVSISDYKINPTISNILYKDLEKFLSRYSIKKIEVLNSIRSELVRKNSQNIDDIIEKLYYEEKINLDTFLSKVKEYKIEDLKDSDDLIESIYKNSFDSLEKSPSSSDIENNLEILDNRHLTMIDKSEEQDETK